MKGVILAAGVGSRLRPLTNNKPKCMVKVAGKTMLEYQIDAYRAAGIKDIYIVVGYEGSAIVDYCKHIKDLSIHIVENSVYENTNNMYSLYLLRDELAGQAFILNNADLAIDNSLVSGMVKDSRSDIIAVDKDLYNDESMKISVNSKGNINDIAKTIKKDAAYGCSIDYYKLSSKSSRILYSEIVKIIEEQKDMNQWTELALQRLLNDGRLSMSPYDIDGLRWVEIDNYDDLQQADILFSGFDTSLASIETIFLDLDGTVYLGNQEIKGSDKFIESVRRLGKKVYFLSNNSSKDKSQYVERLKKHGVQASEKDIILSTDGLVHYMKNKGVQNVYVLGTDSLKSRLNKDGFVTNGDKPEYVVVGYDTELTYAKLSEAAIKINQGADILATHCDVVCPTENGPIPDVGTLIETLRLTTGKSPEMVFGKPSPEMINHILDIDKTDPKNAAVVGDRLYTDIELAKRTGTKSILVLSGETDRNDLDTSDVLPSLSIPSLASLVSDFS